MPDPRAVNFTTEVLFGFKDGSATGFDEYGRRPWQRTTRKHRLEMNVIRLIVSKESSLDCSVLIDVGEHLNSDT